MLKAILFSFPNKTISQLNSERNKAFVICGISFGLIFLSCFLQSPPFPFDTCLFKIITGLPCPSCGMTHAFINLGHCHVQEAFFDNLMGPVVYFALFVIFIISVYALATKKPLLSILWRKWQRHVFISVVTLATISWIWNIYKHG